MRGFIIQKKKKSYSSIPNKVIIQAKPVIDFGSVNSYVKIIVNTIGYKNPYLLQNYSYSEVDIICHKEWYDAIHIFAQTAVDSWGSFLNFLLFCLVFLVYMNPL